MRKDKNKIIELRKQGYSIQELSKMCHVSKSTVSLWTKEIVLDFLAKTKIQDIVVKSRIKSIQTNKAKRRDREKLAKINANKIFKKIKLNKVFPIIILALIYQCEGSKDQNSLRFTNSDKDLVKMFLKTLRESFEINESKLRVCVHLHDYHDKNGCLTFWSSVTNIPILQFTKTYIKKSNHKYKKADYLGCIRVSYHDAHIARTLSEFAKKLFKF